MFKNTQTIGEKIDRSVEPQAQQVVLNRFPLPLSPVWSMSSAVLSVQLFYHSLRALVKSPAQHLAHQGEETNRQDTAGQPSGKPPSRTPPSGKEREGRASTPSPYLCLSAKKPWPGRK